MLILSSISWKCLKFPKASFYHLVKTTQLVQSRTLTSLLCKLSLYSFLIVRIFLSACSSEILSTQEAKGSVKKVSVIQRVKYPLNPTHCSGCGNSAAVGKELKRCSKCSAVAYCNR